MHSPAHRKAHRLSASDLGHFDPAEFIAGCDFRSSFLHQRYDWDIPYAGGITVCGGTFLMDRSIPRWFYDDGSSAYVPTDTSTDPSGKPCNFLPRFWMPHEDHEYSNIIEAGSRRRRFISEMYMKTGDRKWVIGSDGHFNYEPSHQMAESVEEKLVVALGLDLEKYTNMCDGLIEIAFFKDVTSCPANLFLAPYEDPGQCGHVVEGSQEDEHGKPDLDTLKKIAAAGGPKSYMLYGVGERGGHDGAPFWGA